MSEPTANGTESPPTPLTFTTRRGLATASFSLGFWALLTFWWYPFGLMIGIVSITCGLISLLMGVKTGHGEHNLAPIGIGLSTVAISLAIGAYRFVQLAFEGSIPFNFPWMN